MQDWIIKDIMVTIKNYLFISLVSGFILFTFFFVVRRYFIKKLNCFAKRNTIKYKTIYLLAWLAFFIYVSMLVCIVLLSREPGSRDAYNLKILGMLSNNHWQRTYAIENILLFMPFGFLFPQVLKKHSSFWACSLSGMLVSMGIEAIQLITKRGYGELDDILNNILGAMLGNAVLLIVRFRWNKLRSSKIIVKKGDVTNMTESNNKRFFEEVNIARGIGVLLVLLGHSLPGSGEGRPVFGFLHSYIYSFHMPLFFIISGFVFTPRYLKTDTLRERVSILWSKFKRLMIPYLFYSILTLVLKIAFSAYAYNKFDLSEFYMILLGRNPNGGLWFLWTLFFVTIPAIFLNRVNLYVLTFISLIMNLFQGYLPENMFFLSRVSRYFVYFCIGMVIYQHYGRIGALFLRKQGIALALFVTMGLLQYFNIKNNITVFLVALIGSVAVWIFAANMLNKNNPFYKLCSVFAIYGMDVYLLSYFVQVPIRIIGEDLLSIPYHLTVLLMFCLGGLIPILASKWIIRKSKLLNAVFIGSN